MFEFIQLCIKFLAMVNAFLNTKYADRDAQRAAYMEISNYFYQVVCKVNVYGYINKHPNETVALKQYKLGLMWRYTAEQGLAQASAAYFSTLPSAAAHDTAHAAQLGVRVSVWASKLGYEVTGV